jgi:WD40 repeat protein
VKVAVASVAAWSVSNQLAADEPVKADPAGAKPAAVSYYRDIRPILQANCQGCHQPAKAGGSLDMTSMKSLLKGGDSEMPSIVPGKLDESYLIEQITPTDGEAAMPQGKKPLTDGEIAIIKRWIEEGAKDDSPVNSATPIDAEHPPVYTGPPVITSIDWSPDGALLAVAGFHEVLLHKADGSGVVARLVGMSERIESVRFSPDGAKLAVTGGRPAQMGEVQVWDVASHELLLSVPVGFDTLYGASWSPDGKRVAFGGTDTDVRVIDAETGEQVLYQGAHDDWVLDTVFSVDGSHLASVGRDMSAKLIEVATQRFIDNVTSITPGALKGGIQSVERHPLRDEILFGGADGVPRIYRMHRVAVRQIGDDSNLLWELPPLPGRVFSVDITGDGQVIAAGSSLDGTGHVHVYQMEPTPVIPEPMQAILNKPVPSRSPDETAQLRKHFDAGVKTLAKVEMAEGGVYAVALSPSGDRVVAAGGDGMVRIYNTQNGGPLAAFRPVEIAPATDSAIANNTNAPATAGANSSVAETRQIGTDPPLPAGDAVVNLLVEPATIGLDAPSRYAQVVVTAELSSGAKIDVTRHASYSFASPVAKIDATGIVQPLANGNGQLQIALGDKTASIDVHVSGADVAEHPDFIRDVAPVLARAGCNAGTCHGAQAGKNGFKLSLRGYDPVFDLRALADDLASRRVSVASPDNSLMLLKPTAAVPHVGGQVLKPGSQYYETLRRWIADGAHLNLTTPRVTSIQITPSNPIVESIGARQQMRVVATYADGTQRDVTREAFLESGNTDIAKTVPEQAGLLESLRRGEAPVLVRYQGNYAATTLTVMGDRGGFAWEELPASSEIDKWVAAKLQRTKTLPSPLTSDYEFVRRVYLDLTGLPPTPAQIEEFVSDKADPKAKRDALVDKLVGNDDYIEYWTNKWADLLLVNRKFLGLEGATALRAWIRGELAANTPYDQFVRKIITATGSTKDNPAAAYFKILRTPQAAMENTTHLFLATRFNCNKCHDHPFERWTQDQYYQMAAYFAQVNLAKDPAGGDAIIGGSAVEAGQPMYEIVADAPQGEVKHERTGAVTAPAFPFQAKHEVKDGATRREQLAAWMTSPDNPYFAKSYVNRIWGYLMGRGIVEPLDDIRAGNPPTNPELLTYLTSEFVNSGFNVRHVMALICKSRTYQLSVETNKWNEDDQINFSHARARRLPAEVLYDAIYRTTGATSAVPGVAPGTRAATLPDVGAELPDGFLGNLGRPARESACECERSSNLQLGPVMALVSGPTVGDAISDPTNGVAKMVAETPDNQALVDDLFLRFLNRPGKPEEVDAAVKMFQQIEDDHAKIAADADAYAKELAPKVAETELERQGRVAGLQAEIEAHREIAKLRRPHLEREHADRLAKARAAYHEYDKSLLGKLPEWETKQADRSRWTPLTGAEMSASYPVKFTQQPDASIFVEGDKAKGTYRIAAPIPLDRVTGIRLEALADDRLPARGPGRAGSGNYVITEFTARSLPTAGPQKLVHGWDFSGADEGWQAEDGATVVSDSGMRHLFGTGQPVGMKTTVKLPAGLYLLEVVTGIRAGADYTVQWTTAKESDFDAARSARRSVRAGDGGRAGLPIAVQVDSVLTGLRIIVEGDGRVLPIDAVRLFAVESGLPPEIKLQNAEATFAQGGYAVATAIDGNSTAEVDNGWAIAPSLGQDHMAKFDLVTPIENAKGQILEISIHQNFADSQHSLGRFRISVTDAAAPFNLGLPGNLAAILAKPADQRTDAERKLLLEPVRQADPKWKELADALTAAKQPLPEDQELKQLEAQLAAAMQPMPVDPKLQQLRRAVALSADQLKDRRLTVAQDIVWALINSPSFLYNH